MLNDLIASQIATQLNTALARQPYGTLRQKQDMARWLNGELRSLGIGIRNPKSDSPKSVFLRGVPGHDGRGRFQLCFIEDRNNHVVHSFTDLQPFEFIGLPNRDARISKHDSWAKRVTRGSVQKDLE